MAAANLGELGLEKLLMALPSDIPPGEVKALSFAKKSILSLPKQMAFLKAVRKVDFSDNLLSGCESIGKLLAATQVNLSSNRLTSIVPLSTLRHVVVLNIAHNNVKSLQGIEQMKSLSALVASENQIDDISPMVGLTELTTVVLSRNPLGNAELGPALETLTKLRKLSMSGCHLRGFPPITFPLLNELRLSQNEISEFPADLTIKSLKILDLSTNKFTAQSIKPLWRFHFLKQLNMKHNPVTEGDTNTAAFARFVRRTFNCLEHLDGKKAEDLVDAAGPSAKTVAAPAAPVAQADAPEASTDGAAPKKQVKKVKKGTKALRAEGADGGADESPKLKRKKKDPSGQAAAPPAPEVDVVFDPVDATQGKKVSTGESIVRKVTEHKSKLLPPSVSVADRLREQAQNQHKAHGW